MRLTYTSIMRSTGNIWSYHVNPTLTTDTCTSNSHCCIPSLAFIPYLLFSRGRDRIIVPTGQIVWPGWSRQNCLLSNTCTTAFMYKTYKFIRTMKNIKHWCSVILEVAMDTVKQDGFLSHADGRWHGDGMAETNAVQHYRWEIESHKQGRLWYLVVSKWKIFWRSKITTNLSVQLQVYERWRFCSIFVFVLHLMDLCIGWNMH